MASIATLSFRLAVVLAGFSLTTAVPTGLPFIRGNAVDFLSSSTSSDQSPSRLQTTGFPNKAAAANFKVYSDADYSSLSSDQTVVASKPPLDHTVLNDAGHQALNTFAVLPVEVMDEQHAPGFSLKRRASKPQFIPESDAEVIEYRHRIFMGGIQKASEERYLLKGRPYTEEEKIELADRLDRENKAQVAQDMLKARHERQARQKEQDGQKQEEDGNGDPAQMSVGDAPSWEQAAGVAAGTTAAVAAGDALVAPALAKGLSMIQGDGVPAF